MFLLHLLLLLLQLLQQAIIIFLQIWLIDWQIYLISLSLVDMGDLGKIFMPLLLLLLLLLLQLQLHCHLHN